MDDKPKPRPIVLDVAILAYLGDFITMVEKGVKTIAQETLDETNSKKEKSNTH